MQLLRESHFPHQLSKTRVGTYRIELVASFQAFQIRVTLLIGSVQPSESLIFFSQFAIKESNSVRRCVGGLALRLHDLNGFGESASPATCAKSFLHSRSKIRFPWVT